MTLFVLSRKLYDEFKYHTFSHDANKFNITPICHLTPEQARYASTDAWATLLIYEDLLAHEQLDPDEVIALKREEKERQIEHQQEIQDQRLREQGIEPPPHLTLEEREERQAAKRREARKRKRHRKTANKPKKS